MPDKARRSRSRHRGVKRARRALAQLKKSAPASVPVSSPKTTTVQSEPIHAVPPISKPPAKTPPEPSIKITPVKELKMIGIVAGSMFLILFILAFILK